MAAAVLCAVSALGAVKPSPAVALGFESLGSTFTAAGGTTEPIFAGSHPELLTVEIALDRTGPSGEEHTDGAIKDLRVELPPGLVATPALVPKCPHASFIEEACPPASAVGSVQFAAAGSVPPSTLFLLEPTPGEAGQLGFQTGGVPITLELSIARRPPYNLVASLSQISQTIELFGATLKLEGTPGGKAFLALPASCDQPLRTGFAASSWQDPVTAVVGTAPEPQSLVGCESLSYSPSLELAPTTTKTASPSGMDLSFGAADSGIASPTGRVSADSRRATVSLPPGLTINPPVAAGLAACPPAQLEAEAPGEGCPEDSKLGRALVTTPLLAKPIAGDVFLVDPGGAGESAAGQSPTHFDLYLVLRDRDRGIELGVPLRVDADPVTGRLSATLDQVPQLHVSRLEIHFNSGPHAPLTTPATCGVKTIAFSLSPSSGNPPRNGSDTFTTSSSDCKPRFDPNLNAGTISNAAGHTDPFVLELGQDAAAPNLSGLSLTMPAGLSASFAAAAVCPEARAIGGDCPSVSKLGYARIAVGSGPEPLWVPSAGKPDSAIYLAGPYRGAPYSFLIVIPAQVGPFDFGTIVLRASVAIDPRTAQASFRLDDLPQILGGVPLHYRTIRVVIDRSGFIRNPTSCEPGEIVGTALASDGESARIASSFQAADCAALPFRPRFSIGLSGAVGRNGHPAVRAVARQDPDGAALARANFVLPRGELLDLRHVRKLCPRGMAADRCPGSSRLGSLRLDTPLLDAPLVGPVYMRVPSGRLPDLTAEARSGGLRFLLRGRVTGRGGRLGVRLGSLPDVPLSKAVLNLPGGRRGLVVNSESLCRARPGAATASFSAHNGKQRRLRVPIRLGDGC